MKTILTIAAAAITTAAIGEDRPQDRWNLADLYPTVEAWSADAQTVEARSADVAACKGHLGDSAKRMLECLELQSDVLKRYFRLAVYANELYAEDTGQSSSLSLRQRSQVLGSKLTEAASFVSPEVLQIGPEKVQSFLKEEKGLAVYRHSLDDILRMAPHTLDLAGEALIASFQLAAGQSSSVYTSFANSDMPWPTVKLSDGQEVKLDQAAYTKYRDAANRDDRKLVMDSFFGKFKEFERTMGVAFYGSLKEDTVYTRVRKYPDTMTRALDRNRVPRAVYDALIKATNDNLPTLHRYFRLRTKMLGIPAGEMRYYDIYPPLVPSGRKYPVDEAVQMMLAAVRPLGDEYVAALKKAVDSRWMDVYPRPKKLSGAHMAGYAYDVHPYVLLNHNDNYESVSTLAHEWGHAMHSYFSNKTQPFPTARYAIFVAEIASTTNEALLLDYALKTAKNDDERLLYLGSALEELRGTFFRQAMFGEFEQKVHALVDGGQAVTGDQLTKIYGELLRRYHGDAVKIDDLYTVEWAYIPHFYNSFYVYQYATSIAASSLFAEAILRGDKGARERYLKLISSGGSDYPYDLVKAAGVDLATPAPYDALVKRMNRIMDEIEKILARQKK
ncbi:MAG: oligoendopeptidase F [Betaproteobacteria bacterium]|nr:oligoendopeptidase F [Betaproteobacteria bacterium]